MVCWFRKHRCRRLFKRFPPIRLTTNIPYSLSCYFTGSVWFQTMPSTARNNFLADLSSAAATIRSAVVPGTNQKQTLAWKRYLTYLHSIAITNDPYLEQFTKFQRQRILGAFAQALRDCRFHPKRTTPIKSQQCRASVDCVAQTYIMANRPDPRLDTDGKHSFLLLRQYRGYNNLDPPVKPQAAITGSVLREFYKSSFTELDKSMCQLFIGAFFFAMRSCEYLNVKGKDRKTKILCLRNIRFFHHKKELRHNDPSLKKATTDY